jgi:hypothetical protein
MSGSTAMFFFEILIGKLLTDTKTIPARAAIKGQPVKMYRPNNE